jgi:hypothetical protein
VTSSSGRSPPVPRRGSASRAAFECEFHAGRQAGRRRLRPPWTRASAFPP